VHRFSALMPIRKAGQGPRAIMTTTADNTPVIIGVGQFAERPDDADYQALSPMDLGGEALAAAIADCGATGDVAGTIDTIAAIRQFEISTPRAPVPFGKSNNPPRSYGKRVGANPERAILEIGGGQGNQKLIGEFAADIAEGRSEVAAIVGSEAISTVLTLMAKGETPDWSEEVDGQLEDRGFGMGNMYERMLRYNGLRTIVPLYALFENRRRADLGKSLDEYRRDIAELFAPFSAVAAKNPYAASPVVRSAEELATVTKRNRIIAEPYARMTVARDQVNQAAALLLASVGKARELGIPEEKWIYIHAVTQAAETTVLSRPDLGKSTTAIESVRAALDISGMGMDAISYIDLYSCFAIPVFNITDAFGIAPDDPRGLTLTGGLPFFGGAGNNYSAHAIAEAVLRLRKDREAYAFINANGGAMHKNAVGIYSARPALWPDTTRYTDAARDQDEVDTIEEMAGEGVVETYTVVPGKTETVGAVVGQVESGERFVARAAPDDAETLAVLQEGEPFGRKIIVRGEEDSSNVFTFAD
jgi:acetyl-CoA C-acetyltransferase